MVAKAVAQMTQIIPGMEMEIPETEIQAMATRAMEIPAMVTLVTEMETLVLESLSASAVRPPFLIKRFLRKLS